VSDRVKRRGSMRGFRGDSISDPDFGKNGANKQQRPRRVGISDTTKLSLQQ
jgi:hypothetical protein